MAQSDQNILFDEEELKGYLKDHGFPVGDNVYVKETGVYNTGPNKNCKFAKFRVTGISGAIEYTVTVLLSGITHN